MVTYEYVKGTVFFGKKYRIIPFLLFLILSSVLTSVLIILLAVSGDLDLLSL